MKLKLALPKTNQSWTLKPGRSYTIGTSPDCAIALPTETGLSDHHITLNYDEGQNAWKVTDVSQGAGVYVDGATIQECLITRNLQIDLAHRLTFMASAESEPKLATPPPMIPTPPPQSGFPSTYPAPVPAPPSLTTSSPRTTYTESTTQPSYGRSFAPPLSSLPVLTWREYVSRQVQTKPNGPEKLFTWFQLTTGLRNTPWVKSFSSDRDTSNFNSFEGYIIPNFKGSVEKVISAVENELGQATRYEDTDCYVSELTDTHIANTLDQSLLKPAFFPIHRGEHSFPRGDYRRFCVTSYHRVRSYLLIEKYGSDLFVSWITRYEPEDSFIPMMLWLIVASFLSLVSIPTGSVPLFLLPIVLWSEYFLLTPLIMQSTNTLPNAANARVINLLVILLTIFVMGSWIGSSLMNRMFW